MYTSTRRRRSGSTWSLLPLLWVMAGCGDSSPAQPGPESPDVPSDVFPDWPDALEGMPRGAAHTAAVCARGAADTVLTALCSDDAPAIDSLADLQDALKLGSTFITDLSSARTGALTALSVTAHSTGLSIRSVSAINPRLIAVRAELLANTLSALAFARGEQFVELLAKDPASNALSFYVVGFRQACNDAPGGCSAGDLLTPAIEQDWTELTLYDEQDLENTVLDCAPCHQPGGPGSQKLMRMQELNTPWTHWFFEQNDGGRALLSDYLAAHGDETYAGMTAEQIKGADPNALTTLVLVTNPAQLDYEPFNSLPIEAEIRAHAEAVGSGQPQDNSIPGESKTWRAAYERQKSGIGITLPYHDVKITDASKLAAKTAAYQAFRQGELAAKDLPDLREILPDDLDRLARIGVTTDPALDGRGVLLQACAQCHNPLLDPALSRSRFRADLEGMSRQAKDAAIARLMLPRDNPLAMPPARLRVLSPEAISQAIEALRE